MAKKIRIFSPLDGKLIPLKECPYPIFASGAIGHGIAIKNPTYGIFAPFGSVVTLFLPIGHAIGLKSNDGIEIFIHIGIDDDELSCEEFKSEVKVGETVKPGQLLLKFSPPAIKKAVYNSMTAVIVTNHAEYGDITFELGSQSITVKAADFARRNNLSKEKTRMEETKFTILGESLSGKTCYLLAMYSAMSEGINGYSIVAKDDRLDTELLESFEKLDDDSISNERFPGATDQTVTYLFNLNYAHKPIMPFKWIDYPGRIMRDKTDEDYPKVAQNIRESSTLFICVDGDLLVGDNTARKIKNVKRKCSMTINRYFGKYFEAGGHLPPVGIILTKSDLFMHDTSEDEIREILQEAFSPLFVAKNIKIGVIPVTLGENIADDNYSGEVEPVNIHLPIFMGIWFALNDHIQEYTDKLSANRSSTSDLQGRIYDKNSQISNLSRNISNMQQNISNMSGAVREEQDSFFLWRDDDKIRNLQRNINQSQNEITSSQNKINSSRNDIKDLESRISRNREEAKKIQEFIDIMQRDREKFREYLDQIMWFVDGCWQEPLLKRVEKNFDTYRDKVTGFFNGLNIRAR